MPRGIYIHKSPSEETLKKMSKGLKKSWANVLPNEKEIRLSGLSLGLGDFKKGHIPWNKGKHISVETKKKMSIAKRGKKPYQMTDEIRKRMSETHIGLNTWCKGKQHSKETRKKMSGKNSVHWKGGISFEPYSVKFNKELRELIRNRDGHKCRLCNMPECENIRKLSVHHINYDKKNCLPSNLLALCVRCNTKVNFKREYWTGHFTNLLKKQRKLENTKGIVNNVKSKSLY